MENVDKNIEYASQISEAIKNLFRDEENQVPAYIDLKGLEDGENGEEFFIGYLKAGTLIFNELTNGDKNNLEFTHILNQLCVQDLLKDKPDRISKNLEI